MRLVTYLPKRLCPFICPSIRSSVRPSVHLPVCSSVRPSVTHEFSTEIEIEKDVKQERKTIWANFFLYKSTTIYSSNSVRLVYVPERAALNHSATASKMERGRGEWASHWGKEGRGQRRRIKLVLSKGKVFLPTFVPDETDFWLMMARLKIVHRSMKFRSSLSQFLGYCMIDF